VSQASKTPGQVSQLPNNKTRLSLYSNLMALWRCAMVGIEVAFERTHGSGRLGTLNAITLNVI